LPVSPAQRGKGDPGPEPQTPRRRPGADLQQPRCRLCDVPGGGVSSGDGAPELTDITSSGGRLVFHIFGALAEFEHDLIRERTIAGLQAARARGRKGGRKPAMSDADVKKAAAMLLVARH